MNINDYLMAHRDSSLPEVRADHSFPVAPYIVCKDGFKVSVQATHGAYCSPRTNTGPWHAVELGFPSDRPTDAIMQYCEDPERPTDTVSGYVPVELVEDLIAAHGGMADVGGDTDE